MNKQRSIKRAKGVEDAAITRPAMLKSPVSDGVAVHIGLLVTEYVRLEQRMEDIFRAVLRIESGEAASLAYNAIAAPSARWKMIRKVLEQDHSHIGTSHDFDDIISEFEAITAIRNRFVHGLWSMDQRDQPWLASVTTPSDGLRPRRVRLQEFLDLALRVQALDRKIIETAEREVWALDRQWLARLHEGSPTPQEDEMGEQNL